MKFSDCEWKLMSVLWTRGPLSARELAELLRKDTGWANTTVRTMLCRLTDKGAVAISPKGNGRRYKPLVSEYDARTAAIQILIDKAFNGRFEPFVQQLLRDESLSCRTREALFGLVAEIAPAEIPARKLARNEPTEVRDNGSPAMRYS